MPTLQLTNLHVEVWFPNKPPLLSDYPNKPPLLSKDYPKSLFSEDGF